MDSLSSSSEPQADETPPSLLNNQQHVLARDLTLEALQEMATADLDRFKGLDFSGIESDVLDILGTGWLLPTSRRGAVRSHPTPAFSTIYKKLRQWGTMSYP